MPSTPRALQSKLVPQPLGPQRTDRVWIDAMGDPGPLLSCPTTVEPRLGAPVCSVHFRSWSGATVEAGQYGPKAMVEFDGEPLFAELAVVRWLQRDGWDAVWVARYGGLSFRAGLPGRAAARELPRQPRPGFHLSAAAPRRPRRGG